MTIALLTLALAVPALVFAVWPLLGGRAGLAPALADDERAGIENEKLIALRALRELELDRLAGHVDMEDYRELHSRYEANAVAVLRRLDALGPATHAARPAPVSATAAPPIPWTRQPVVLGAARSRPSRLRRRPGPPRLATLDAGAAGVRNHDGPAGNALRAAARAPGGAPRPLSKEMLEGMLQAAHASLDAGRYQEAIAAYTAILKRDQRNVDAITHMGVILALAGHHAEALEAFDRALAIDPNYAHALWDKAGVQEARQDHAGAVATLERFVRVSPPGPDRDQAQQRLRDAKARLAAAPSAGAPAKQP